MLGPPQGPFRNTRPSPRIKGRYYVTQQKKRMNKKKKKKKTTVPVKKRVRTDIKIIILRRNFCNLQVPDTSRTSGMTVHVGRAVLREGKIVLIYLFGLFRCFCLFLFFTFFFTFSFVPTFSPMFSLACGAAIASF